MLPAWPLSLSQNANRDWIAVKNLILSGGDAIASMTEKTITGKRINAYGSLTCGNRPVFSTLKYPSSISVGVPATLSALSINCESAVGLVTLTTLNGEEVIQLYDGGLAPDLAAGDGIFTGKWTPSRIDEALIFSSSAGTETVAYALLVFTKSLPFGTTGAAYNQTLTAVGGSKPYTWSVSSGALPAGLALNPSSGVVSGTPTTTGTSTFTVQVKDASAATATRDISLTVYDPLVVSTQTLTFGTVGVAYSQTLTATGGKASYTWSLAAGSVLPGGLSLDPSTGVISGSPTTPETANFTMQVTDANATTATKAFSIVVYNPLIVSTQSPLPWGMTNTPYSQTLVATGGKASYTWSLSTGSLLPDGLTLDTATGVISGTPTAPGTFAIAVQARDANATTAEKSISITLYDSTIKPDLVVSSVTAPTTGGAGLFITLNDTVKNNGPGAVLATTIRFYLSTDTSFDNNDTMLTSRAIPALLSGDTNSGTTSVAIPTGTASGTYYIIARADGGDLIVEVNEDNNSKAGNTINIGPDLGISALIVPGTAGAGASIAVTDTTKNNGAGDAGASTTSFYLSTDTTINTTAVLLTGRSVGILAAGATSQVTTTVTIPATTLSGQYYLIVRADDNNAVGELSEDNNTLYKSITIGPDLAMSAVSVSPTAAGVGITVTITDTTKNNGPGTAAASTTRFYLSTDSSLDSGDALLTSRAIPELMSGETNAGSTSAAIPTGTLSGYYYIIAKADGGDLIVEVNETDNTKFTSAIKIGPDLSISTLTVPTTAGAGTSISVTDTTKNGGAGEAGASTTSFYLSADTTINTTAVLLTGRSVGSIAAQT